MPYKSQRKQLQFPFPPQSAGTSHFWRTTKQRQWIWMFGIPTHNLAMGSVHQGGLMLHVIDYEIVVASQLSACFE